MLPVIVFHDVLCTWCYVFSKAFNKVKKDYEGLLDTRYVAWPLYPHSFEKSSDRAKESILKHWEETRKHPDAADIDPDAMADKTFVFPYSIPALAAVKCAELQKGQEEGHARYYDALQHALYINGEDINDLAVLKKYAKQTGLNVERFVADFNSGKQHEAVYSDLDFATESGINAIPSTIIGHEIVLGAVPEEELREIIDNQLEDHDIKAA